jgi:two-component system cell cycle response regulator
MSLQMIQMQDLMARSTSHSGEILKILVADDSAVFRKLVEQTLTDEPYTLLFAKTGHEAIRLFEEHRPAVVIVDWVMPDLTGIEICQHIRATAQRSYTYTIILTAMSDKQSVVEGLNSGADDYLTKPFHGQELIARLRTGMRIIELQRQIEASNILLKQWALTDDLTGLPNRRAIEDWAYRQISSAGRHKFSFWVAMADLDHFKRANDTFGHDAGDQVLKGFAEILKAHSRRSDICGRLGGEEFFIAMTHVTQTDALRVIDRIRTAFAETTFSFMGRSMKITASFGVSGSERPPFSDFSGLVANADAALYEAKRLGRNRIEVADGSKQTKTNCDPRNPHERAADFGCF